MAILHGTNGDDYIDYLNGITDGADTVYGHDGNDTITGGGGNDWLIGGNGVDNLIGGDGDDMLIGGEGWDFLSGNSGTDTASYADSDEGVVVDLAWDDDGYYGVGFGGTAEGDFLMGIENLIGSSYADTLTGDTGNNVLDGGGGSDTLNGEAGADTLWGGGGADTLNGGGGADTLKGGGGADTLNGGNGNDTASYLESNAGVLVSLIDHTASGGEAQGDTLDSIENLTGSLHVDTLAGDNGSNVLDGLDGNDTLKGYGGADSLYGGDGADSLYGMDGTDTLLGGNGSDTLLGGNGADTLLGGGGNDTLTGGGGPDAFVFNTALNAAGNVDEVTDFNVADDIFHLDNAVFSTLPAGTLAASAFRVGAAAADASDRVVYNSATGALMYDADGIGGVAAVQFAQLGSGLALTNSDFLIV
jgi:Ca2+-binding RTX toxin-like protein